MKTLVTSLALLACLAGCSSINADKKLASQKTTAKGASKPSAIIELFTSQGCSSCPPADRLLGKTIDDAMKQGKNIFALSFHVDYWNRLGWTDPFSAREYTERQRAYAAKLSQNSVYTPQMVVNGRREFVGSEEASLKDAIDKSLSDPSAAAFTNLTAIVKEGLPPIVKYSLTGNYNGAEVHFALVSLRETTAIKRGENSGVNLTNENVVRQFVTAQAAASGEISFKNGAVPSPGNIGIVGFIQRADNLEIIGAAQAEIK